MNSVEITNITKTFSNVTAVDDLTLAVPKGSIYGFIGPNGSGKTTTLRMIMNIFYPDSGDIRVFGEELHGETSDRIGYLPEERGLYKKMKVKEILKFYGSLKNGKNLDKEADIWLEKLELSEWANKKVNALSKGMSQKVQFIATVISKPELLILDEPFTGLDPVNTDALKNEIIRLAEGGTTVIFSTHDMNIAEKLCDFIFMIYQGQKVLDGTLESIQQKFGQDTLRIHSEGGAQAYQGIPGIEKVNDFGQQQELRMTPGTDSQAVLSAILAKTRVSKFEVTSPSLNDIFIRIARPEINKSHE